MSSLPSIRDVFPDIMPTPRTRPIPLLSVAPTSPPPFAFTVLRTDPYTCSLEHLATSTSHRRLALPHPQSTSQHAFRVSVDTKAKKQTREPSSIISFSLADPPGRASTITTSDGRRTRSHHSFAATEVREDTRETRDGRGKKHQCPHCSKRFNRPSSLKIHVNTHTGAKPYPCPYPGCGREFNVNSNMRRHWRNHTRPTASSSSSLQTLSAISSSLPHAPSPTSTLSSPATSLLSSFSPASSATSLPSSSSSSHPSSTSKPRYVYHDDSDSEDDMPVDPPNPDLSSDEEDELDSDQDPDPAPSPAYRPTRSLRHEPYPTHRASYPHREPHTVSHPRSFAERDSRPGSNPYPVHLPYSLSSSGSSRVTSPSYSRTHGHSRPTHAHSPRLYTPSIPAYARSCDERVSTALRPAFASGRA